MIGGHMTDDELDLENRIVTASYTAGDDEFDTSLRPRRLSDYIGQEKAKENLSVYIEASHTHKGAHSSIVAYKGGSVVRNPFVSTHNFCMGSDDGSHFAIQKVKHGGFLRCSCSMILNKYHRIPFHFFQKAFHDSNTGIPAVTEEIGNDWSNRKFVCNLLYKLNL